MASRAPAPSRAEAKEGKEAKAKVQEVKESKEAKKAGFNRAVGFDFDLTLNFGASIPDEWKQFSADNPNEYKIVIPRAADVYFNTDAKIISRNIRYIAIPYPEHLNIALTIASENRILCVPLSQRVVVSEADIKKDVACMVERQLPAQMRAVKQRKEGKAAEEKITQQVERQAEIMAYDTYGSRVHMYNCFDDEKLFGQSRKFLRAADGERIQLRLRKIAIDEYIAMDAKKAPEELTDSDRKAFKEKLALLPTIISANFAADCALAKINVEAANALTIEADTIVLRQPLTYYIDKKGKVAFLRAIAEEYNIAPSSITLLDDDPEIVEKAAESKFAANLVTHDPLNDSYSYNSYLYRMLLQNVPLDDILIGIMQYGADRAGEYTAAGKSFRNEFYQFFVAACAADERSNIAHRTPAPVPRTASERIDAEFKGYILGKAKKKEFISDKKLAYWATIKSAIKSGDESVIKSLPQMVAQGGRVDGSSGFGRDNFGNMLSRLQNDFLEVATRYQILIADTKVGA